METSQKKSIKRKKKVTRDLTKYQIISSKATEKAKLKNHKFKNRKKWVVRKPRS